MTLKQLLKLDYKMNSVTMDEIQAALTLALTLPPVQAIPALASAIEIALLAITTYNATITIIQGLYATYNTLLPIKDAALDIISDGGASTAAKLTLIAQQEANQLVANGIKTAQNTIMNTEIPGT